MAQRLSTHASPSGFSVPGPGMGCLEPSAARLQPTGQADRQRSTLRPSTRCFDASAYRNTGSSILRTVQRVLDLAGRLQ